MTSDLVQIVDRMNQQAEVRLQQFADRLRQHQASRDQAYRDAADRLAAEQERRLARAAAGFEDRPDPARAAVLDAAAKVSLN
jgi:ribosomal protein L44E